MTRPGGPRLTGTGVLLLAAILAACFPTNRPGVEDRGAAEAAVSGSDTVRVILHNPNFLDANVRLYGDGAQVGKFFVGGHSTDTAHIRRRRLRRAREISAVVEPIGSTSAYPLGDYMLPEDATEIRIDIRPIPRFDDG